MNVSEWRDQNTTPRSAVNAEVVVSRILVIDVAVEKTHHDVQHWGAETNFVSDLAAKHTESFGFHGALVGFSGFRLLFLERLLLLESLLPLVILLMPVIWRSLGERRA